MIIKTKSSHHKKRFEQLIKYIMSDKGRVDDKNTFTITHNLRSTDIEGIIKEFQENDKYRKKRTKGIVLYHEIISYHPDNKDDLNLEILEDMARKFIELRGKNALCFAKPHIDNDNIHIHFCFSGVEYKSEKTLRLDKQQFKSLRIEMEKYQQKYPSLNKSLVYLNKWEKQRVMEQTPIKQSDDEYQMKKRTGKQSKKDLVRELVKNCYQQSTSKDNFFQRLIEEGLELYMYREKINGLIDKDGRKHRFKSLALGEKEFALLEKNASRMLELQNIRQNKERSKDQDIER